MKTPKDIFNNRGPLTETEMKKYISGDLSEAEKHEIELKMSEDDFNSDAMEGVAPFGAGAFDGFADVKSQIEQKISDNTPFWQFKHTIMVAIFLAVSVTLATPLLFGTDEMPEVPEYYAKKQNKQNPELIKPEVISEQIQEENLIAEAVEITDFEIDEAIELPEIELVSSQKIAATSPVVIDTIDVKVPLNIGNEVIKLLKVKVDSAILKPKTPKIDQLVYSNVKLISAHKFTLVDYSTIYTEKISVTTIRMSGLGADQESKGSEKLEPHTPTMETVEVTYIDYLLENQKLFSENDFKSALKGYKIILSQYPEDLNALFYSGLCYYNLGKHKLAIKYLDLAQKHIYNSFKIDAEWYKALTYFQWKKYAACGAILDKIIKSDNYYSDQAKELKLQLD
ncbi:MAG: hypothetical protein ACI9N1_001705 [Flavobacteriales bacterium]|jgi:hypothetical protein